MRKQMEVLLRGEKNILWIERRSKDSWTRILYLQQEKDPEHNNTGPTQQDHGTLDSVSLVHKLQQKDITAVFI